MTQTPHRIAGDSFVTLATLQGVTGVALPDIILSSLIDFRPPALLGLTGSRLDCRLINLSHDRLITSMGRYL